MIRELVERKDARMLALEFMRANRSYELAVLGVREAYILKGKYALQEQIIEHIEFAQTWHKMNLEKRWRTCITDTE